MKNAFEKWERHETRSYNGRVMIYIPGTDACVELKRLREITPIMRRKGGRADVDGNDILITWPSGQLRLYGFVLATGNRPSWDRWERAPIDEIETAQEAA